MDASAKLFLLCFSFSRGISRITPVKRWVRVFHLARISLCARSRESHFCSLVEDEEEQTCGAYSFTCPHHGSLLDGPFHSRNRVAQSHAPRSFSTVLSLPVFDVVVVGCCCLRHTCCCGVCQSTPKSSDSCAAREANAWSQAPGTRTSPQYQIHFATVELYALKCFEVM
jgi:hypothetical protein